MMLTRQIKRVSRSLRSAPNTRLLSPHIYRHGLDGRVAFPSISLQSFSTSFRWMKKGNNSRLVAKEDKSTLGNKSNKEDPYDFVELENSIAVAIQAFKDELRRIRPGGQLSIESLEDLKTKTSKESPEILHLRDLAHFVPRGKIINVIAGEEIFKKQIISAILSSGMNIQPQADPINPLQLNITMPSTTTESRKQAVFLAGAMEQLAVKRIRDARQTQHKKHNSMKSAKSALPDDLRRASSKMEKVIETGLAEVKRTADAAKKALENS